MSSDGFWLTHDTLRFERTLPGPIERVWAHLVEPELRALWLASGPIEARVGGALTMIFHNDRLSPIEEVVPERYRQYDGANFTARITAFEPPHLLAHTWDDSEVRFELTALDDGRVRLVLTHRGLGDGEERTGVLAGWHTHLDILGDRLAGAVPRAFWATHLEHENRYEARESS